MSNLEYVDLEYGVRVGYQTRGEGLDGDHDFLIIQFPLHEGEWPYGGVESPDPEYLKELIITSLFDMASGESDVFHNGLVDKYTIQGWQA